MDINDKIIADNPAELKLLIDSSAYLCMNDVADAVGIHPLVLIEEYPKVDYFFSTAVANELIRGREGAEAIGLLTKSLQDEMVSLNDALKDARILYNAKDGSTKVAVLTAISSIDHGQILLCQNHPELVLLTNDHRMLKNAAAVLDKRLMDFLNLLELMSDTPNKTLRNQWLKIRNHYEKTSGYRRPKTVRFIPDRRPGELPKHWR